MLPVQAKNQGIITSRAGYSADGNCMVYTKDALEKQTNYCYNGDVSQRVLYHKDAEEMY